MTSPKNCTDPISELLVPLAQGQLGAEDSGRVLDHIEHCPACSTELDFLADLVTAAADGSPSESARTASPPAAAGKLLRFPYGLLGGLAAAAALLFLVVPMFLAQDEVSVAPYAEWTRPTYRPIRTADAFEQAMTAYNEIEGADGEAIRDINTAVEAALTELIETSTQPLDARAYLYRAAVRVELERTAEARDDLIEAAALGGALSRDHVLWSLANVHLMLDDADEALSILATLAEGDGTFKDVAAELAAEVRAATR